MQVPVKRVQMFGEGTGVRVYEPVRVAVAAFEHESLATYVYASVVLMHASKVWGGAGIVAGFPQLSEPEAEGGVIEHTEDGTVKLYWVAAVPEEGDTGNVTPLTLVEKEPKLKLIKPWVGPISLEYCVYTEDVPQVSVKVQVRVVVNWQWAEGAVSPLEEV
jgi:hypothetical protein